MRYKIVFLCFCLSLFLIIPIHLQAWYFARWHTSMGDFTAILRDDLAPITVTNFINLTDRHFYDGLHFHRIIHNSIIQDGDPLGTGYGGPGYTIADEFNVGLHHDVPGMLAMANTGQPHSGGSQYYITLVPRLDLDGHLSIFGKVIQGMDVVQSIGAVPADSITGHPDSPVFINTIEIMDLVINSVTPSDSMVVYDMQNSQPFIIEAFGFVNSVTYQWLINGVAQADSDFMFTPSFPATGVYEVRCVVTNDDFSFPFTWHVTAISVANNDPVIPNHNLIISKNFPNPFRDETSISYQFKTSEPLQINVYDIRGRLVYHDGNAVPLSGMNRWSWKAITSDGTDLTSGIYLFEFKTAGERRIVKGILIR